MDKITEFVKDYSSDTFDGGHLTEGQSEVIATRLLEVLLNRVDGVLLSTIEDEELD